MITEDPTRLDAVLLVDTVEVGRRLSLSPRSVKNLIYDGQLESVRIGRSRRITITALHDFMERLNADGSVDIPSKRRARPRARKSNSRGTALQEPRLPTEERDAAYTTTKQTT